MTSKQYAELRSYARLCLSTKSTDLTLIPEDLVNDAFLQVGSYDVEAIKAVIKRRSYDEHFRSTAFSGLKVLMCKKDKKPQETYQHCKRCGRDMGFQAFTRIITKYNVRVVDTTCMDCRNARALKLKEKKRIREIESGVKNCRGCKQTKELIAFKQYHHHSDPNGLPRYTSICIDCQNRRIQEAKADKPCRKCNQLKNHDSFRQWEGDRGRLRIDVVCIDCRNQDYLINRAFPISGVKAELKELKKSTLTKLWDVLNQ